MRKKEYTVNPGKGKWNALIQNKAKEERMEPKGNGERAMIFAMVMLHVILCNNHDREEKGHQHIGRRCCSTYQKITSSNDSY
jgi:hypothetical protein